MDLGSEERKELQAFLDSFPPLVANDTPPLEVDISRMAGAESIVSDVIKNSNIEQRLHELELMRSWLITDLMQNKADVHHLNFEALQKAWRNFWKREKEFIECNIYSSDFDKSIVARLERTDGIPNFDLLGFRTQIRSGDQLAGYHMPIVLRRESGVLNVFPRTDMLTPEARLRLIQLLSGEPGDPQKDRIEIAKMKWDAVARETKEEECMKDFLEDGRPFFESFKHPYIKFNPPFFADDNSMRHLMGVLDEWYQQDGSNGTRIGRPGSMGDYLLTQSFSDDGERTVKMRTDLGTETNLHFLHFVRKVDQSATTNEVSLWLMAEEYIFDDGTSGFVLMNPEELLMLREEYLAFSQ